MCIITLFPLQDVTRKTNFLQVAITLDRNMVGKVCGMCGDYNGEQRFGFRTPDGELIRDVQKPKLYDPELRLYEERHFGNSWFVPSANCTRGGISSCGIAITSITNTSVCYALAFKSEDIFPIEQQPDLPSHCENIQQLLNMEWRAQVAPEALTLGIPFNVQELFVFGLTSKLSFSECSFKREFVNVQQQNQYCLTRFRVAQCMNKCSPVAFEQLKTPTVCVAKNESSLLESHLACGQPVTLVTATDHLVPVKLPIKCNCSCGSR